MISDTNFLWNFVNSVTGYLISKWLSAQKFSIPISKRSSIPRLTDLVSKGL